MPVSIDVSEQRLTLAGELLSPGRDFQALLASESGHFAGEVVFAGYGISDAAAGWDDYAWVPEGAVVLVLEGRPPRPASRSSAGPRSRGAR